MIKISNTYFQCKIISVFPTTQEKNTKKVFSIQERCFT